MDEDEDGIWNDECRLISAANYIYIWFTPSVVGKGIWAWEINGILWDRNDLKYTFHFRQHSLRR